MCELRRERAIDAYRYFIDALTVAPDNQVAILQLIPCAYALSKFDDLERHLRSYLELHPDETEMRYCLGGCLFKMDRVAEASAMAEQILAKEPNNTRAAELRDLCRSKLPKAATAAPTDTAATAATPTTVVAAQVPADSAPTAKVANSTPPTLEGLTAKADAALNKLIKSKSSSATVIEKITIPGTTQASVAPTAAAPSQQFYMIDMDIVGWKRLSDPRTSQQ